MSQNSIDCPHLQATDLKPPTATQKVYKDECCHCFVSQDSIYGIDVCLTCFESGCLDPEREHAAGHYALKNHPIVLNIRRTEKPKLNSSKAEVQIEKLAIPAETDSDHYEYHTTVKCRACGGKEISSQDPNLVKVIDSVMNSLSSSQQNEVKAWEQEMIACEHTLTLQQASSKNLESQALASCSKCDLNENLWLCLVCGNLACGRKQFGGGGGNGHGLEHVDTTSHSLAVKLGSITPEGTADVYCYECNEERVDPELKAHLSHWGINIAERQKTEKSLNEMQIEQNMKWEFSMTTEDGKDMVPLFGPGLTGMKNIGNSCYLASIVQCLFTLPAFAERFYGPFKINPKAVVADPTNSLEIQLRKMADGLLSGRFSTPSNSIYSDDSSHIPHQKGVTPSMLKELIGRGHAEFSTMRQQDAFEFLLYLTQKISRLQHPQVPDPTSCFRFVAEQRTQCVGCQRVSYRKTNQENISVLVPARRVKAQVDTSAEDDLSPAYESITFQELLDLFTAEEKVEYTCSACGSKQGALKRTQFATFPEILVFNPGRFAMENWVPVKLEIPVAIPHEGILLDGYLSKGLQPSEEEVPEENAPTPSPPSANPDLVGQLETMGFPIVRCQKALLATGNTDTEAAMQWIFAHMEDPDIDEPTAISAISQVTSPVADPVLVAQLADMGFPEIRCEKAALATGNSSPEAAMNWLMEHMDDPDIDVRAATSHTKKDCIPGTKVDESAMNTLCDFGFSAAQAKKALKESSNNVERATDWLFSHPDDTGDEVAMQEADAENQPNAAPEAEPGTNSLPARYHYMAMACHKGGSIHAGHYVAFVKKQIPGEGLSWVLFNDERVVKGVDWEEASKTAYVYFMKRE